MSRFDDCLKFVLRMEGGYSNTAGDHGGATLKGCTQATYSAWRKQCGLSDRPVSNATNDEIISIYKTEYWVPCKAPIMPEPIDAIVFDSSVQHGVSRAVKMLQQALGVSPDGDFGLHSIDALHEEMAAGQVPELAHNFMAVRNDFYDEIAQHPGQAKFAAGWAHRMEALATFAGVQ